MKKARKNLSNLRHSKFSSQECAPRKSLHGQQSETDPVVILYQWPEDLIITQVSLKSSLPPIKAEKEIATQT